MLGHYRGRRRRFFAKLAAVTLALAMGGSTTAALANPLIDTDLDGSASLTIHKHELQDGQGSPSNGLPADVAAETIDGVEFTITPVAGIDLTSNQGWLDASALAEQYAANPVPETITAEYAFGASQSAITGVGGTAGEVTFDDLPFGLYYVRESDTPTGVIAAQPFLVTVPLTHPETTSEWIYDVHVYPKNQIVGGSKEIEDSNATQVGDTVSYRIMADIPSVAVTDLFLIRDSLPEQMALTAESIQVGISNGASFTSEHYTLSVSGNRFEVELTQAGRQAAHNAVRNDASAALVVSFDAVIEFLSGGLGDGTLTNQAEIFPNSPSLENETPIRPEVTSKWGELTVLKVDSQNQDLGIEGVIFEVWAGQSTNFADAAALNDPITGNARIWSSNADGVINIGPLRYSSWANGDLVAPGENGYLQYWLVENQAAEGYQLPGEPIAFTVDESSHEVALVITNTKTPPPPPEPDLPDTGQVIGWGAVVIAVLLLIAGVVLLIARRRRGEESENPQT